MSILIALSGLPGVGKTTLAKDLAARAGAIHLRLDSVESALKRSALRLDSAEDAGYLAIASVAKDNLLLGFDVIADTVNPLDVTRRLWARTAAAGAARLLNVEVICSDRTLHQHRVETRKSDVEGLVVPNWQAVSSRTFEPWEGDRLIVDTGIESIGACTAKVQKEMASLTSTFR